MARGLRALIEELWSDMAKSAPGAYFPRPPTKITYSFDQGSPAPETYPVQELADYARRVILDGGTPACDYLTAPDEMTRGYLGLRKVLAKRLAARDGRDVTAKWMMLVNGSSHGLSLIAAAFINPGDGVIVGTPAAMKALDGVREDLGVNQILPRLVEAYIEDGKLEPHLDFARGINLRKRDIALAALREHCEPLVRFQVPQGGIFFWLELAPEVDADVVREKTLAAGVACRPGERLAADDSGRRFLRLSFLHVSEEELTRGIEVLGDALRASVL